MVLNDTALSEWYSPSITPYYAVHSVNTTQTMPGITSFTVQDIYPQYGMRPPIVNTFLTEEKF